ncbi:MAG: protein translocase subunit SecF [Fusobacteriaceae bacterium]|nr:protein translocase subunit SecF [Fusobacteriaceae bacterium]
MRVQIIGKSKLWLGISAVLVALALVSIMAKGLNLGIDFTGGSLFEIKFEKPITLQEINPTLDEIGKSIPQFSANSRIAQVDEKGILLLRTQTLDETQKGTVLEGLKNYSKYEVLKSEKVGATVGKELLNSAILSLILGSLLIIAYISFRFELKFALGGVIALVHDIIIAIGVIALLGYEINSSFIAAILTILGYSINDTIVVYDRIRENLKRHKGLSLENIIDNSVNDVMRRSLNTSFTTLLAVLAVLIFGGDTLKSFMVTLLVGIGIGTYSSIFVASPVVYLLEGKLKSKIKL